MWRQQRFHKVPRIILAFLFSYVFLFEVAFALTDPPHPSTPTISQQSQDLVPQKDGTQADNAQKEDLEESQDVTEEELATQEKPPTNEPSILRG